MDIPSLAGTVSTGLFVTSVLPMLAKAWRTKDLRSYSLANLVTSNVANVVHALYVVSLPAGPIWALHGFYLVVTALMLGWALLYRSPDAQGSQPRPAHPLTTDLKAARSPIPHMQTPGTRLSITPPSVVARQEAAA